MASRAGHCEVAQFLLQNTAQADARAKVRAVQSPFTQRTVKQANGNLIKPAIITHLLMLQISQFKS